MSDRKKISLSEFNLANVTLKNITLSVCLCLGKRCAQLRQLCRGVCSTAITCHVLLAQLKFGEADLCHCNSATLVLGSFLLSLLDLCKPKSWREAGGLHESGEISGFQGTVEESTLQTYKANYP